MGQAGELPLHPHKLSGVAQRLLLGLIDAYPQQIAVVCGTGLVANAFGGLVVKPPNLFARRNRQIQRDIGIAVLGAPDDGFPAGNTRDPNPWMWLLHRHYPRVDDPELVMITFPSPRPWLGPGLDDQVVGLFEALAVERRIGVAGEGLDAA